MMDPSAEILPPAFDPQDNRLPLLRVPAPIMQVDMASLLGILFTLGLIAAAILMGSGNARFFDLPAFMIVVLGTAAATSISFTGEELRDSRRILLQTLYRPFTPPRRLASSLMDISVTAKKRGALFLGSFQGEFARQPFLARAMQMVLDGIAADEIQKILSHETDMLAERSARSAGICRRASEIAPVMGLVGTLVGLVQMLANLQNPETIGPAMALALLTTFYGAILGNVIMASLAAKLEKNAQEQILNNALIMMAAASVARADNPRRLEMMLNAELPPSARIDYFN